VQRSRSAHAWSRARRASPAIRGSFHILEAFETVRDLEASGVDPRFADLYV
jgi:hypothetical protein